MKYPRPRIVATVVLGLTGGLLLAGCSSGPTGAAAPGGVRASGSPSSSTAPPAASHADGTACSLITEQEASSALGTDPGPGAAESQGIATSCMFGTPPTVLNIALVPDGGKVAYEHALAIAKAHPLVTISGVGDAAFGTFNNTIGAIEFYKGNAVVSILLSVPGASAQSQDTVTVLAKLAAGRL